MSQGGVRTTAVLRAQTPEAFEQIRAAVRHDVESYRTNRPVAVPPLAS